MSQTKRNYKRGDIVLVLFPNSDLRSAKRRPVVVVQNDDIDTELPQIIVAMVTSKMFRANHPGRASVILKSEEGGGSGLLTGSVVMTDNLATVQEATIDRNIGLLPMDAIDAALRHTLAL